VLSGVESDQLPLRQDTPSATRNSSRVNTPSLSVSSPTPTQSPRPRSKNPDSDNTETPLSSDSGSRNKVQPRGDLAFGSSTAFKSQNCLCTARESTGKTIWRHSGHVDDFLEVLFQLKKSQLESYLPHGDIETLIIFPVRKAVPGENTPWDQMTGYERTAPRRRANGAIIIQHVQSHTLASSTQASGPSTGYGWGSMNAPFDPNLVTRPERPQSPATDSMHRDMSFSPDIGMGLQAAENIWNLSSDSHWVLPQTSTTESPSFQVGVQQSTFNSVPYDVVPPSMNRFPWESTEPLGSAMQMSTTGSGSQGYHVGGDILLADSGTDPGQATFGEDPSTFLPNQRDSLPNLEFHDDWQGADIWMMATSPPVSNILNFSSADTGSSSMSDMSSDFERQLTTVRVSPSIQSQGSNDSVTSTMIPGWSLWEDNGVSFESSHTGEYGLRAGEGNQERGDFFDLE
jgi:hypothetical protein